MSGKFTIKEHAPVQYDEQEGSHMALLPSAYAVGNDFSWICMYVCSDDDFRMTEGKNFILVR